MCTTTFLALFLNVDIFLKRPTPGKLTYRYITQSEQFEIITLKLQRAQRKKCHDSKWNWWFISKHVKIPQVLSLFSLLCNQQTASLPPLSTSLYFVSPCLQLFLWCLARSTKQTWKSCFASSLTASNIKCANLTWLALELMHHGNTWHDYSWPWVSLTKKFAVRFWPIRKEIVSWMYKITVIKHCSLVHDCPTQVTKLAPFSVLSMNLFLLEFMEYSIGCFLLPEL